MRRLAIYVACLVLLFQASLLQAQGSFDGGAQRLEEALRQKEAEFARVRSEFDALMKEEENLGKRIRMRTHWLQRLFYRVGQRSAAIEVVFAQIALRHRVERILANDLAALQTLRKRIGSLRDASARIEKELNELRTRRQQAKENQSFWVNLPSSFSGQHLPLGALAPIPSQGAISFESQRGSLFQPLLAPRSIREVERIDGAGLEFVGSPGAPVYAAAAGRVVFATRHPNHGLFLILDHGNSYFTSYGGFARFDVGLGRWVSRGSRLGALGDAPLFFQVRRGGRALEAAPWLGLVSSR